MKNNRSRLIALFIIIALIVSTFGGTVMAAKKVATKPVIVEVDFPENYPKSALKKLSADEIEKRVNALIKSMTLEEKLTMLSGSNPGDSRYKDGTGYQGGVPRLGVPVMRMWDGPKGVINDGKHATSAPSHEMSLASSFSTNLAYDYGVLQGSENKATAGNVQLGVQLDHARSPLFTRTRDSLGEDPYLTGAMGSQLSKGVEDENVMSTLKHLAAYSNMFKHPMVTPGEADDVTVDEQTYHEIYLYPYYNIIKDDNTSAVMSSYNAINGVQAASNSVLLKDILRDEWQFKGTSMTDWGGNIEISVALGTDLEMPGGGNPTRPHHQSIKALTVALEDGTITMKDIDLAVHHNLTALGRIGYLGLVVVNKDGTASADKTPPKSIELNMLEGSERDALLAKNSEIAYDSAVKGAVLLKNDGALPITQDDTVAVIGVSGLYTLTGHYSESSFGVLEYMESPYSYLKKYMGEDKVTGAIAYDIVGEMIPDEYLYVSKLSDDNGVNIAINDGHKTEKKMLSNVELTTGTIKGDVNRTYKNSTKANDGNAISFGKTATLTTYLSTPKAGIYELKMLGIGGIIDANITVDGKAVQIPFGADVTLGNVQASESRWATSNLVPTAEGMDITPTTVSVELEANKRYEIKVTGKPTYSGKDLQMRLTWMAPDHAEKEMEKAIEAAKNSKKVVIFAHDLGGGNIEPDPKAEFMDLPAMFQRNSMALSSEQVELIKEVTKVAKEAGNEVIVVLNIALPVTMDWIDDVDAVLNMWLGGQSAGVATAKLLVGQENPSGKLPITFPAEKDDTHFGNLDELYKDYEAINNIEEGIFSGYRWYDKEGIKPLFSFGHGLSYTKFEYSNLKVEEVKKSEDGELCYKVSFDIKNTGDVIGDEVAQIYLGETSIAAGIQMAKKQLAGFVREENIKPGETRSAKAYINQVSLSYWDTNSELIEREDGTKDKYVVASGERDVLVGASLDNILLEAVINVE